ncbi:MAG: ExbD/TolR family protein [Planctomycetota bacterium]|jgi:biopolymer transport protein ExbD
MARRSMSGGMKKKKPEEADLDITPMIDVTFLLLIFFMVASKMDPQKQANVPPAVHGKGVDANAASFVTVLADPGGGPGRVVLGDGPDGEEAPSMELVKRYVQSALMEGKELCIVKADRDVNEGKVQEVLKVLGELEGLQFAVGVKDPQ